MALIRSNPHSSRPSSPANGGNDVIRTNHNTSTPTDTVRPLPGGSSDRYDVFDPPGHRDNVSDWGDSHHHNPGSNGYSDDELRKLVTTSDYYRQVFDVFSRSSNSDYWLTELQGIIDSIVAPGGSTLDRFGLSNNYNDKVDKIYNEAISAISNLYARYQAHVNSLPSTAVQQDSVAGINSAITGNIHGSSFSADGLSPNAGYDLPSTNTLDGISTIARFALDATTGLCGVLSSFADVALKFKDLDLNKSRLKFDKDKSFSEFKKILSDAGVILKSSSWDDLDNLDPNWSDNASSRAKALHNAYVEVMTGISEGPAIAGAIRDRGYSPSGLAIFQGDSSDSGYMLGSDTYGFFLEREYGDLGKMQLDLTMAEMIRRAEVGQTNLSENLTPEEVQQSKDREQKANSNYNARKAVIFLERLEQLVTRSNNHDPIASVELINLMNNAEWLESAVYMFGELTPEFWKDTGTTLYDVSSWNSEQFNKVIDFFRSKF